MDFNSPSTPILKIDSEEGTMVARLMGFLRLPENWKEKLRICISNCNATLRIGEDLVSNITGLVDNKDTCHEWQGEEESLKIAVDFESYKTITVSGYNRQDPPSKMGLQHFKEKETPKVRT